MNANDGVVASPSDTPSSAGHSPRGEFMVLLPLERKHVRAVPKSAGCYFIYLGEQPYYAGMSRTDMRKRIWVHATGRGSRMIRQMLADGHPMYFEYCAIDPASTATSARDIARTEFVFMLLHTGQPLPGNLKVDGLSLFPDPTSPKAGSLGNDAVTPASQAPPNSRSNGRAISDRSVASATVPARRSLRR